MECVFCRIVRKEIPTAVVYEDEYVMAFPDAHPIAPVHILVIPKRHVGSVSDFTSDDATEAGMLILAAAHVAKQTTFQVGSVKKTVSETGFKLLIRTGKYGGQEVGHVHLHLLGGGRLREDIGLTRN
jgi:histidine triad (HIT) family protein